MQSYSESSAVAAVSGALLNLSHLHVPDGCAMRRDYLTVDRLLQHGIVDEVNFTGCMPQCGICEHPLTDNDYVTYNLIVGGIILPIIGCLGLIGNSISAFIYSRPEMRISTNLYLCALECSDCAVIITGIFLFCFDSLRKFSLSLTRVFGLLSPIIYPMGMIAQTCSVYFTLAAGTDCFAQVCLPEKVQHIKGRPMFIRCVIIFVLIFSLLYNIPHCFESVVIECYHDKLGGSSWEVCPETLRYMEIYLEVYYKYMYTVFLAVGPLAILVFLNTCIIIFATLLGAGGQSAGDTISLILVVLLFISCNVAALVINALEDYISEIIGPKINYIVDLSNLLVVFNSSFNFIIYYNFSESFRNTLKQYYSRRFEKPECVGPGPPIVIEKPKSNKLCRETFTRLFQPDVPPEVLI